MNAKRIILLTLGTGIGATAGWLYWYHVGCASGTCLITSRPFNSTIYGAVMGLLGVNAILPPRSKPPKQAS